MGISIWQLLIVLVIIVLLFGTKKLKNIGTDLGSAVKGFKSALSDEEKKLADQNATQNNVQNSNVIDGKAERVDPTPQDKPKA